MSDPQEPMQEQAVITPEVAEPTPEPSLPPPPKRKGPVDSGTLSTLQSLLGTIAIAVFVITFIVQAFTIPSESMEKTLLIGDYLLVDKAHFAEGPAHWFMPYKKIQRQEIIVFRYPVHPSMYFVKRVIGLPGDHVRLIDKKVFVNGIALNEPYVVYSRPFDAFRDDFPNGPRYSFEIDAHWASEMHTLVEDHQLIVPDGYYFVMGDNRDDSSDSRYWGFVPRENIVGRPLLIYFSADHRDTPPPTGTMGDKLWNLALRLRQLPGDIRWKRVVRLVR
ncbi:signal peptidase I [Candidatus Koribacter versatilis Ellin345]|uniref:Signal peptidase I n=1 Tax=Koribacter versatilis (strain Ellin345) TaxID=204669 RepID=Q1IJU5_KORVE|nr:signal peptidase I [Candidatus Koribacter versatilis]ABF42855.1 signal peptidase I [Candidatus Koribacter versatilis Ellin345]